MRRTLLPVVPFVLAVLAFSGCGSDTPPADADPTSAAPTASTTPANGLAEVSDRPEVSDPAEVTEPTTADVEDVAADTDFPKDVARPEQGGRYVAVVLATGDQALLDEAAASVVDHGYTAAVSDAGCLQGLAEALDLADNALVSSLLFSDAATARQFADAYIAAEDGLMVGSAMVRAYCLD